MINTEDKDYIAAENEFYKTFGCWVPLFMVPQSVETEDMTALLLQCVEEAKAAGNAAEQTEEAAAPDVSAENVENGKPEAFNGEKRLLELLGVITEEGVFF